jgi:DNA polymerase III subunit gamma/tau
VFEIDAASHTQVDKIRDFIVEKVHFTPVAARFKVYIIDEVHKLSTSSFNALLKTLEEPPPHVVFVLATTHPHEMPSTILSRCQRYDFRPLTAAEAESHLKMIAEAEKIELDEDAARHLARAADGSLRDALVLFEQAHVFSDGRVTREKVLDLLGGVGYEVMEEMFTDLNMGQAATALQRLDDWIVRGRDLKRLAESFQDHLRMLLLLKVRSEDQSIRHLSQEEMASLQRLTGLMSVSAITQWLRSVGEMLGQIRHGRRARLEWEMLLVSLAHPEADPSLDGLERRLERLEDGRPVGSSVEPKTALVPADLMERVRALEEGLKSVPESQPDDRQEARFHSLEHQFTQLRRTLESRLEKLEEPEPEPEPQTAPEPTLPKPSQIALQRDQVDDWLVMPEILVTGRIETGGQTSLLDSSEAELPDEEPASASTVMEKATEDFPSPNPEPEPEPDFENPPALLGPKEFFRLLMQHVKEKDIRLHAVLADARLTALESDRFELAVPAGYDWHYGKIQEGRNLLESAARTLVQSQAIQMECSIGGEKASPPKENEHEELVKRASGVFGGSSIVD